jgi:hypothetical protein
MLGSEDYRLGANGVVLVLQVNARERYKLRLVKDTS